MDLLKLVNKKTSVFSDTEASQGLANVVQHIDIATKHYENGKKGDDYLFTDVIYRTNQAFEGALKEAYRIIKCENPEKIAPYKIEQQFSEDDILKERVKDQYKAYRQEWRNKSVHDYTLYFSEQEAFLAIVNILAFINILLDQMIQKRAYDKEYDELKTDIVIVQDLIVKNDIYMTLRNILCSFKLPSGAIKNATELPETYEAEVIGGLEAYIKNIIPDIQLHTEYPFFDINGAILSRVDLFAVLGKEKVIIELKVSSGDPRRLVGSGINQVLHYLNKSNINKGILYIASQNGVKMKSEIHSYKYGKVKRMITVIMPDV